MRCSAENPVQEAVNRDATNVDPVFAGKNDVTVNCAPVVVGNSEIVASKIRQAPEEVPLSQTCRSSPALGANAQAAPAGSDSSTH